jgi:hypothetical protein
VLGTDVCFFSKRTQVFVCSTTHLPTKPLGQHPSTQCYVNHVAYSSYPPNHPNPCLPGKYERACQNSISHQTMLRPSHPSDDTDNTVSTLGRKLSAPRQPCLQDTCLLVPIGPMRIFVLRLRRDIINFQRAKFQI